MRVLPEVSYSWLVNFYRTLAVFTHCWAKSDKMDVGVCLLNSNDVAEVFMLMSTFSFLLSLALRIEVWILGINTHG